MTKDQLDLLMRRHLEKIFRDPYEAPVKHLLCDETGELWYVSDQLGTTDDGNAIHKAFALNFLSITAQAILRHRHAEENGLRLRTGCDCCNLLDAGEQCDCSCHDKHRDDCDGESL